MILPFSRTLPDGRPTNFREKIQQGVKIHTLRLGNRFKPGDRLHFWDGSPRAKKHLNPPPKPFNIPITTDGLWWLAPMNKPVYLTQDIGKIESQDVALPCVVSVEKFSMLFVDAPKLEGIDYNFLIHIAIEGENFRWHNELFMNDGFQDWKDLASFFNETRKLKKTNILEGQIIHWTKFTYTDRADVYKDQKA